MVRQEATIHPSLTDAMVVRLLYVSFFLEVAGSLMSDLLAIV